MGRIRHDALIITISDTDTELMQELQAIMDAVAKAQEPPYIKQLFIGPVSGNNGYLTYFIAPDGSKEGWSTSEIMDDYRTRIKELLDNSSRYPNYVHLRFGGDDDDTHIVETSDYEITKGKTKS